MYDVCNKEVDEDVCRILITILKRAMDCTGVQILSLMLFKVNTARIVH